MHPSWRRRIGIAAAILLLLLAVAAVVFFFYERYTAISARRCAKICPQLDGSLTVYGLTGPVTVQRDAHGVPHIHASSMDDLIFAQGFHHRAGSASGRWTSCVASPAASSPKSSTGGMLAHDRLQRTLQLRAAADRAIATCARRPGETLAPSLCPRRKRLHRGAARSSPHRVPPARLRTRSVDAARYDPGRNRDVPGAHQRLSSEKLGREALAAHRLT